MTYTLEFSNVALDNIKLIKKKYPKKVLNKLMNIFEELT